ncbi:MAG: hypothetical protein OSB21_07865 [Myxococcota bacterium]|nr:hypothetical protein [Myxococcota bacterium]
MIAVLVIASTVSLSPTIEVKDEVVLRWQQGLMPTSLPVLELLRRCARNNQKVANFSRPLELRIVRQDWLNKAFDKAAEQRRTGRYLKANQGHSALIYLAQGEQLLLSLAHEWLHHLAELSGIFWSEAEVEKRALKCVTAR